MRSASTANLTKTIVAGKTIKSITVDVGKTLYNVVKKTLGSTDSSLFNKIKSVNNGVKNVIEDVTEIKLDV